MRFGSSKRGKRSQVNLLDLAETQFGKIRVGRPVPLPAGSEQSVSKERAPERARPPWTLDFAPENFG